METRSFGAWFAATLTIACIYLAGAGSDHPFFWLLLATVFALASAINFRRFDAFKVDPLVTIRRISYAVIVCCIAAIILNAGSDEVVFLILAGSAALLMIIVSMTHFEGIAQRNSE